MRLPTVEEEKAMIESMMVREWITIPQRTTQISRPVAELLERLSKVSTYNDYDRAMKVVK